MGMTREPMTFDYQDIVFSRELSIFSLLLWKLRIFRSGICDDYQKGIDPCFNWMMENYRK